MNISTVQIFNLSSSAPIFIALVSPETADTPTSSTEIPPSSGKDFAVRSGTMNMFVWNSEGSDPLWVGIIPTKVKDTIRVDPENKKVYYGNIDIPGGFAPVTNFEDYESSEGNSRSWYWILGIVLLLLLICMVCFRFFRK